MSGSACLPEEFGIGRCHARTFWSSRRSPFLTIDHYLTTMEALSRREEEEIEAAAKTEALKQCDEKVKGGLCTQRATRG